jgi:FkbM family methyltransferase
MIRKVFYILRILSIKEFLEVVMYHVFLKKLNSVNVQLFHKLVVILHQLNTNQVINNKAEENAFLLTLKENECTFIVKLRNNTSDFFIFIQVFIRRDYYPFIDHILNKTDAKNPLVILDAGANIGLSCLFFKAYFPNCQVVCLEPDASNYNVLSWNVSQNLSNSKVLLLQQALWFKDEAIYLDNGFRDGSHSSIRVLPETSDTLKSHEKVMGISLSTIMRQNKLDFIDILKVDIEGSESVIFRNSEEMCVVLPKCKYIAVEVHEEVIRESEMASILHGYGFSCSHSGEYLIAYRK